MESTDVDLSATTRMALGEICLELLPENTEMDYGRSFTELGGDSVGVMILIFRIQDIFGVELTPDVLFENPSLESLASEIERRRRSSTGRVEESGEL